MKFPLPIAQARDRDSLPSRTSANSSNAAPRISNPSISEIQPGSPAASNTPAAGSTFLSDSGAGSSGSAVVGHTSADRVSASGERSSAAAGGLNHALSAPPPEIARALCLSPPKTTQLHETLLFPEDLLPLTRRQLFLIVDSDISRDMNRINGRELSYPALVLMSPLHRPSAFLDYSRTGSLFTMFLSVPVMAFCVVLSELDPTPQELVALQVRSSRLFLQ